MIKRQEGFAVSSPIRMLTTSPTGICTDPITRFSAKSTMISTTSNMICPFNFTLTPLNILQYLAEMFYLHHLFVIEVIYMLQLPCDVEGDIDGRGTYGKGRGDVAFEGITNHQ